MSNSLEFVQNGKRCTRTMQSRSVSMLDNGKSYGDMSTSVANVCATFCSYSMLVMEVSNE